MKFRPTLQTQLSAMSLVEVLVVLALVAIFIVGAAQMTTRLLISVKNNEVIDYVTGLQIQALEIAKSPAQVALSRNAVGLPGSYAGSYRVRYGNPNVLFMDSASTALITTCPDNSAFRINLSGAEATNLPSICLQFVIQPQTSLGNHTYYQISTRVIYILNGETYINDLIGYRAQDFVWI